MKKEEELIKIEKMKQTDPKYPRTMDKIKKRPL